MDYAAIDADRPYIDAEQRLADRTGYFWKRDASTLSADNQLETNLQTGEIEHRLLTGIDILRFRETGANSGDSAISLGGTLAPIDVYAPIYDPSYVIPPYTDIATNGISQYGFYAQDQMRWGPWIVVAGLRHDRATGWEDGSEDRKDHANSKRFGVLY